MKNNGRRDRLEIFKKFERMISENKSIYLDLDEIEEIIIHYFHEANYEMAENAIALANQIFPNTINISRRSFIPKFIFDSCLSCLVKIILVNFINI